MAASCRLRRGARLQAPELSAPASYRYEVKNAGDTVNTEWWHQFEDPVLDELIAEALANNKSVKIAAAKVEQASGLLIQTRSPIFPQINYSGSGERQRLTELAATPMSAHPQSADGLPGACRGELGDRSLGPHSQVDRVCAGEPAGHRVCEAGGGPLPGRIRCKLVSAAARIG